MHGLSLTGLMKMFGILLSPSGDEAVRIREDQEVLVGRELPAGRQGLVIDDIFVSRTHAVISLKKEFYIKDLESKNGTFINGRQIIPGVPVPLEDGDKICFGKSEYRFRIAEKKADKQILGQFVCSMRNSAGGRRLQVELPGKGCIEYQLRMIEENPNLNIAEIICVNSIDRDSFLYDVGGCLSLERYTEQMGVIKEPAGFIERILRTVEKGEEFLLERSRYLINEETVFIDRDEEIRLIYVPCTEEVRDEFAVCMEKLCGYLADRAGGEDRAGLTGIASAFAERECSTSDYIKYLYNFRENKAEVRLTEEAKKNKTAVKKEYIVTLISYLVFLSVFWMDIADAAGLCGIFIILAGINIMLYEIPGGKNRKSRLFSLKFTDLKKKPGGF